MGAFVAVVGLGEQGERGADLPFAFPGVVAEWVDESTPAAATAMRVGLVSWPREIVVVVADAGLLADGVLEPCDALVEVHGVCWRA